MLVHECQVALRMQHGDTLAADKSVRVGSSPTNSVSEYYYACVLACLVFSVCLR